ncbi:MAG: hypothetical protein CTY12_08675 [Methylotenera sp.]|nr:MAG: hypothetical protein CTY12_08675 [Methylotenera sp.]
MPESLESIGNSNPSITVKRETNPEIFENFRDKAFKYDIRKFEARIACKIKDYIIAWIWYENSPDYSSQKILVWKGMTESEYRQLEKMDPEFDPSSKLFGVFKPTKDVYNQLIDMVQLIQYGQTGADNKKLYIG